MVKQTTFSELLPSELLQNLLLNSSLNGKDGPKYFNNEKKGRKKEERMEMEFNFS